MNLVRHKFPEKKKLSKREKKLEQLPTCYLCAHFQYSTIQVHAADRKGVIERKCILSGKYQKGYDKACFQFDLTQYFYCGHCNQRVNPAVCLDRQGRRVQGCNRSCRGYGKTIALLLERG